MTESPLPPGGVAVGDPPWEPWHPSEVHRRLAHVRTPWYVAAGWAVDLHLGRVTREHEDLEIGVPAAGFAEIHAALADHRFEAAGDGRLWELPNQAAFEHVHQTWVSDPVTGVYRLDVFREPHDDDVWICRRDDTIRMPYADLVLRTAEGIPYQRPETVLLFKAKHARPKDDADLAVLLPHLDGDAGRWLRDTLSRVHPGHRWLEKV